MVKSDKMPKNSAAGRTYGGFTASKIRRAVIFPADFRRTNFLRRIRRSAAMVVLVSAEDLLRLKQPSWLLPPYNIVIHDYLLIHKVCIRLLKIKKRTFISYNCTIPSNFIIIFTEMFRELFADISIKFCKTISILNETINITGQNKK